MVRRNEDQRVGHQQCRAVAKLVGRGQQSQFVGVARRLNPPRVDDKLAKSVRNLPGVSLVGTGKLTARAVADADRVIATKNALEKLQETLS